jgi:hypothetical protein
MKNMADMNRDELLGYLRECVDDGAHISAGRAIDELERRLAITPPPNTVPVRIAVAVNDRGEWRVSGSNNADDWTDWTKRHLAADALGGDCLVSFITAHVPLPEQPAEVEGKVE